MISKEVARLLPWMRVHSLVILRLAALTFLFTLGAGSLLLLVHRFVQRGANQTLEIWGRNLVLPELFDRYDGFIAIFAIVLIWASWSSLVSLVIHLEFKRHFLKQLTTGETSSNRDADSSQFTIAERILLESILAWVSSLMRAVGSAVIVLITVGLPALAIIPLLLLSLYISMRRIDTGSEVRLEIANARRERRQHEDLRSNQELIESYYRRDRFLRRLPILETSAITILVTGLLLFPIWTSSASSVRTFHALLGLVFLFSVIKMATISGSLGYRASNFFERSDADLLDDDSLMADMDEVKVESRNYSKFTTVLLPQVGGNLYLLLRGDERKIGGISMEQFARNLPSELDGIIATRTSEIPDFEFIFNRLARDNNTSMPVVVLCNQSVFADGERLAARIHPIRSVLFASDEISSNFSLVREPSFLWSMTRSDCLREIMKIWSDPKISNSMSAQEEAKLIDSLRSI
jgi:hypothetical protein